MVVIIFIRRDCRLVFRANASVGVTTSDLYSEAICRFLWDSHAAVTDGEAVFFVMLAVLLP